MEKRPNRLGPAPMASCFDAAPSQKLNKIMAGGGEDLSGLALKAFSIGKSLYKQR